MAISFCTLIYKPSVVSNSIDFCQPDGIDFDPGAELMFHLWTGDKGGDFFLNSNVQRKCIS